MNSTQLKYLLRSGSLRFVRDHHAAYEPGALSTYAWKGNKVWYRPGTSDTELIYKILLRRGRKGEYAIEPNVLTAIGDVETVLDIGANIGISTLYLAMMFPQARVFAFEPVTDNFSMLERNVQPLLRVKAIPVALGERDGTIDFFSSDHATNFGGFSRFEAGSDVGRKTTMPMRHAGRQLAELGVTKADVIKIDVEGSECEILTALGNEYLRHTKYVTGELHGHRDFELLATLSEHFKISVKKNLQDRLFMFRALNRTL
jgi:FkbM family methyltransferase